MNLTAFAYLASYLLSLLGNSLAAIALPLLMLQVTGSVLGAGIVSAATAIPALLAGLFMGVVIDRINRRTSSVITDLISALCIAALPLVDLISGLSLGWFVLFGILGSLGDVPGMTAREALLPAVVRRSGIPAERLTGIRESLGAVALLLGPAAAGTLIVLVGGTAVLWITAATSLAAALLTLLIPRRVGAIDRDREADAAAPRSNGWTQLRDGWRVLLRSRFLVATTILGTLSVTVLAALQGLLLPVYFTLVEQPGMLGFVLTAMAAGMLISGMIYALFGSRGRRRVWFVVGAIGMTIGFAVIASLASVWVVLVGGFVTGAATGLFSSLMGVLMIERIPERMRGRIMGTQNALTTVAPALGIMAAAVLTELSDVRVAAIAVAALWIIALAVALFARSLRNLDPIVDPDPVGVEETVAVNHA
ncbi:MULTISPECIES: MFS transporter [unclassified Microbacterium]|uniref:MFS transporter n=1 Tax=unclassified Microbacterium TaxID=2609290 RepID=UPI000EAA6873|nr:MULTISPECIES: MFS transporter [unclassified Microbacterium]MBT2484011.1 MFS transporter [Microbacterium sp. ISL-108]RKN66969.1 MFS transporter [Microbacterium sp. CGR2]